MQYAGQARSAALSPVLAQIRERVLGIQRRLKTGLRALAGAAAGDRAWTAEHLDGLKALAQPLLASPLVGEGAAFDAVHALARALPEALGDEALSVACSLRLVELAKLGELLEITCLAALRGSFSVSPWLMLVDMQPHSSPLPVSWLWLYRLLTS